MKAVQKIKKMVALGMGLTMVGATIMGASALTLKDYPAPFVTNGVPSSNLAVVVGDDAKGVDTLAAADILTALQGSAVSKLPGASGETKITYTGNAVEIGTPSDLLELREPLGDVKPKLTVADMPGFLGDTTITTQQGVTLVNQYLTFDANSTSLNVSPLKDEFGNYGTYLTTGNGNPLFTWTLQFQEGLRSATADTNSSLSKLPDFESRDLNILGQTFTVVEAKVETLTATAAGARDVQITLLGGPISDSLGEAAKKTYTLSTAAGASKEYEVEVLLISETSGEVLLKVNGQSLPRLKKGETEHLADGTLIGVKDIIATGKDTQSSVVQFYVGATKIFLKDTGLGDDSFTISGAEVNNEVIEDSSVKIKGSLSTNRDEVTIESIDYQLRADALKTVDVYVSAGKGVREVLDEPEGMLAPTWDIRYEGLKDTGETVLKWTPVGVNRYEFSFVNQAGKAYTIPLLDRTNGLNYGIVTNGIPRDLRFRESSSDIGASGDLNCTLGTNDFAIFSAYDIGNTSLVTSLIEEALSPPSSAFTSVLKYESIDTTNSVLTFTDLAGGTKQVTYSEQAGTGTSNRSTLIVDGRSYSLDVCNNGDLSYDGNADGVRDGNGIAIVTEADAIVTFRPADNTDNASTDIGAGGANWTITIQRRLFDERTSDDHILGTIVDDVANTRINGNFSVLTVNSSPGDTEALQDDQRIRQKWTGYGGLLEAFIPTGNTIPPTLTYKHPLSQRGAQVFVTAGEFQKQTVSAGTNQQINPVSVGATKLASEVAGNLKSFDAVVVGGPCANPAAAELLGNPADCAEGFTPGKALVRLFDHGNGNMALLVAGYSGQDTRRAGKAVVAGQLSSITGTQAEVSGQTLTDFNVKAVM